MVHGIMYSAVATVQQFQNDDSSSDCLDLQDTKLLTSRESGFELTEKKSKPFILRRYWRSIFEILLILAVAIAVALPPIYKPTLLQRQHSCGRLLGQSFPDADPSLEYEVQRFKGTFGLKNQYTGWGPEVDAAWDNITGASVGGAIGITKQQWEAANSHDYPVLLDKDYGTGQYLASFDVFHQLHCVDILRKSLHREYYNKHEESFTGAPENVVQEHLEHCVEMLRQTIMCHGDISLLTYNWVKGRKMPHPNFNTVHTCKKWDSLIRWNLKHNVTIEWIDGQGKRVVKLPIKPKDVMGLNVPP